MQIQENRPDARSAGKKPGNPVIYDEDTRAKADLAKSAKARLAAFKRVSIIVPLIERVRDEVAYEKDQTGQKDRVSDSAIAKWLNSYAKRTKSRRYLAHNGDEWTPDKVRNWLFPAPDRMIFLAVLECRTRMFEISERANFEKPYSEMHVIEKKYLDFMAKAVALEHKLWGNRERSMPELIEEARIKAVDFANEQRQNKPISMTARYMLWDHKPPFVEMAFQNM